MNFFQKRSDYIQWFCNLFLKRNPHHHRVSAAVQQIQQPRRQFLQRCVLSGIALLLNAGSAHSWARQGVDIRSVRFSVGHGKTSIIFDLSAPVEHNIFTLLNPDRVVIDFNDAKLLTEPAKQKLDHTLIEDIRYATRNDTGLRMVLDLRRGARPKSFLLPATSRYGHRLLVELVDKGNKVSKPVKTITGHSETISR